MVAGFVAGYMKTKNYETALKMGTAAGSATAFSDGLAKAADIDNLLKTL
jgi:1-phosphofructokinase